MRYSIVVPCHEDSASFRLCLAALKKTIPSDAEIVAVLNNEDKSRLPRLKSTKSLKVVYAGEKLGYSRAINLGVRESVGAYLVLCDSDTFMRPGWLEAHAIVHAKTESIGITSSKLVCSKTGRIQEFGIGRTFYNHFHPFRGLPPDHALVSIDRRVQMACSACMMISRDLFLALEMLDENLSVFYQDIDLCLRLKELDKECWVLTDSVGFHKGGNAKSTATATQVDERGYFTSKNASRLEQDFDRYMSLSFAHFLSRSPLSKDYCLVDLSTLSRHTVDESLRNRLHVSERKKYNVSGRDLPSISLLENLRFDILKLKIPLVIFTDVFASLRWNTLWLRARDRDDDLVIDRHANIQSLRDIVMGAA